MKFLYSTKYTVEGATKGFLLLLQCDKKRSNAKELELGFVLGSLLSRTCSRVGKEVLKDLPCFTKKLRNKRIKPGR